mmetsp:Transcript_50768/g.145701  ORF Transcript_50768/g.145701 Transcript_50768/m.145701 type:complete len:219 (-) Transcript_50768:106-762(-)|eukprot:CAMPEP_0177164734 /NCGR_PEP_ID=MMETSP0367-20130122/7108_1 /TAXON_ID=447022 ORGANISM="Scrippsiella hangoei-like, Strain SHHI-4" /NCGR_SAMPLE_ID=MMETSP0367 /ASSEMBLY_ACC=CAM_ASM_000362 /LENGTH=218 /DNA_ID=CAMNT_0018610655 /DNA_START=53 /DNA_END=709 /DNA_ORIENTATION=-
MVSTKVLGGVVLAAVFAGVLLVNSFFWRRYFQVSSVRDRLVDGTCKLTSTDFQSGLSSNWAFPITGPSWTSVHCYVHLEVEGSDGKQVSTADTTQLAVTMRHDGIVFNIMDTTCRNQVPKTLQTQKDDGGHFYCAYATGPTGRVEKAYVGKKDSVPHLPKLLLMKACGLSFWTLGPILLMLLCFIKNTIKGAEARTLGEACDAYAKLEAEERANHIDE